MSSPGPEVIDNTDCPNSLPIFALFSLIMFFWFRFFYTPKNSVVEVPWVLDVVLLLLEANAFFSFRLPCQTIPRSTVVYSFHLANCDTLFERSFGFHDVNVVTGSSPCPSMTNKPPSQSIRTYQTPCFHLIHRTIKISHLLFPPIYNSAAQLNFGMSHI